jgi:hypothetical protein
MLTRERIVGSILMVVFLPILAPWIVAKIFYRSGLVLFWYARHGRHGRRWLAVYSDGAKWREHFESEVLPIIQESCVVINISKLPSWKNARSLERRVHREWGGRTDHTPILLRMPLVLGRVDELRFYEAYLSQAKQVGSTELDALLSQARQLSNAA